MRFPGWAGHALLGRIAYETLPRWEKDLIKPDMSAEGLGKPYIPDIVKTIGDKTGYMCAMLDLIYNEECRPYATLPDGRWIPHTPPDAEWQSSVGSRNPRSPVASTAIVELLMTRMVRAIRADNWEDAIRHGGALAHHLQEPFTPGHAVDNAIFQELFPDPDSSRHVRLHHIFDNASGHFEPRPPDLMGTTIAEAAFRLVVEIDWGIREGKKLIRPVIDSFYEGQPNSRRAELLAGQSQWASYVTACAWHTAICIGLDRFDPGETERLETLPLTQMLPYFWHACEYAEIVPNCLVEEKRKIPIHVWSRTPGGKRTDELVEDGFGMGGHMGAKFYVNGDVYRRFQCRVGLPSRQTEGQTEHTACSFFVEIDSDVNTVYSEDIEYNARTLDSFALIPGEPVRDVDVDITGARSLILRAQSTSYIDAETGQVRFSVPHVAVCEPVLYKR